MKRIIVVLFFVGCGTGLMAQVVQPRAVDLPQVVSSSGGFLKNSGGSVSFTVGESMIPTYSATTDILTLGFQHRKKLQHAIRCYIFDEQSLCGPFSRVSRKSEEHLKRVAIGCRCIWARVALVREMPNKEGCHEWREIMRAHRFAP